MSILLRHSPLMGGAKKLTTLGRVVYSAFESLLELVKPLKLKDYTDG